MLCLVICCWTVGKGVGQNAGKQPLAFEDFSWEDGKNIRYFPVAILQRYMWNRNIYWVGNWNRAQVNKGFDMVAGHWKA
ncbi:MAG: hypothetical protein ACLTZT_18520 [Butyricimonas faecalis]